MWMERMYGLFFYVKVSLHVLSVEECQRLLGSGLDLRTMHL